MGLKYNKIGRKWTEEGFVLDVSENPLHKVFLTFFKIRQRSQSLDFYKDIDFGGRIIL